MPIRALLTLVARYTAAYRGTIAGVAGLQLIATLAALLLPSINADIIDRGVVVGDTRFILRQGAIMLGVSLVNVAATIAATFLGARTAMAFGRDLRRAVFTHVADFSAREVGKFGPPSLITRNTNDVQQVQMALMMSFSMLLSAPMMMIGGVIMALREDLGLSWLVLVAVPLLGVSVALIALRMVPGFRAMQARIDRVNEVMRAQISGIRVVRAFVRENVESERFRTANRELTEVAIGVGRYMAALFPVVLLVLNLSSVAVLWFGGIRVADGAMEIGSLTAFLSYLMQILIAVMMSTFVFMIVPRAAVSADRIVEVLDTEPSVRPPERGVTAPTGGERGLVFERVSFAYPGADHPVLSNVSFSVKPGETLAIIGSTGAGKSTLVGLIPRLFDATEGTVKLDGVDVRDYDPEALWSLIGLVPQKAYLFSGTIASNLRYGRPDATEEEMWRAIEVAQARDFVSEMPEGLEAPIAQGGTNVSGGQRQRLAIARALIKRPYVYVFDDAFSALDVATDARLRAALAPYVRDAITVIVAQRVSTVESADKILVLEDGRVVGLGRHEELLETSATYREIVVSQRQAEAA